MGCLHGAPSQTFLDCFLIYRYGFLNREEYSTVCNTNEHFSVILFWSFLFCLFSSSKGWTKNASMKKKMSSMKNYLWVSPCVYNYFVLISLLVFVVLMHLMEDETAWKYWKPNTVFIPHHSLFSSLTSKLNDNIMYVWVCARVSVVKGWPQSKQQ